MKSGTSAPLDRKECASRPPIEAATPLRV